MYWLRRPPYLRWFSAALILIVGLAIEFRDDAVEPYPFAAQPIDAGADIGPSISWREVPRGLLPQWSGPVTGVAARDVPIGEPVTPSLLARTVVPKEWWSVPIPLPTAAAPGTPVRVVLQTTGTVVDGIVVESGIDTGFETVGMVAFSPTDAPQAAAAVADSALVVMIGHGTGGDPPAG